MKMSQYNRLNQNHNGNNNSYDNNNDANYQLVNGNDEVQYMEIKNNSSFIRDMKSLKEGNETLAGTIALTTTTTTTTTTTPVAISTTTVTTSKTSSKDNKMMNGKVAPIAKIFIDDLTERRSSWRIPWFTLLLGIVQIIVFVITNECLNERLMFVAIERKQYWRYLTYMLLHADLLHLLLNVALQCLVGFTLENEQGCWRVAAIYMLGGVSGSLAVRLMEPTLSLIGASAGVYAMLLSHVPHLQKNFIELPHRYLRIAALLILSMSDIFFTVVHYMLHGNTHPRICVEAHVGGALAGLIGGWFLYRRLGIPSKSSAAGCCGYLKSSIY